MKKQIGNDCTKADNDKSCKKRKVRKKREKVHFSKS